MPNAGSGLFTTHPVKKGTVVYRFDLNADKLIPEVEVCTLSEERQLYIRSHGRYCEDKKAWAVDGDDAAFINHAEEPTLRGDGPLGQFIAAFDLSEGTELTLFYPEICDISRKTGLLDTSKTLGDST